VKGDNYNKKGEKERMKKKTPRKNDNVGRKFVHKHIFTEVKSNEVIFFSVGKKKGYVNGE
jgi:hypothetical protein